MANKTLARRYAELVIRFRIPILFIVLIGTIAGALQIENIDIRNDPDTLLPPSNRYVATNAYAEQTFGMGNLMVFGLKVKEGDIYQPWFINTLQRLHREIAALPTANQSNFISLAAQKIKYMGADENGLIFKRLIPTQGISTDDPELAKQQLDFLREGIENNPIMSPMLVHAENKQGEACEFTAAGCVTTAAFIIADYSDEVKDIYLPWVRDVRNMVKRYSDDDPRLDVLVAGEPYFLAYMLLDLVNKWWLFALSLIIVIIVLGIEFRSFRGAIFPLLGVGATIVLTLGLMGLSGFKLTTMMVLTPMLLLAIGIGHSVQITRRFEQEYANNSDITQAVTTAIEHTIVPATLSIVTDMVGFATLSLVDISFYKAYAYFGMFGMLTLILTTTTLIPLLMLTFQPKRDKETSTERGWEIKTGTAIQRLLIGKGKWIPVAVVVGIIAVSTHYTKLLDGTPEDWMPGIEKGINYSRAAFKEESETIQHLTELANIMPGVISVNIPIRGKKPIEPDCNADGLPKGCFDVDEMLAQGIFNKADVLYDIEQMENWMRKHPYIGFTGSYAQYVRLVNMLLMAEPGEKPSLKDLMIQTKKTLTDADPDDDRNPDEIVEMYNGLLEVMTSDGDMDSFVSSDWNNGVIMGFVNTMDPVKTHQTVIDIQKYIEEHKNDAGFKQVNFGYRNADASGDTGELATEGEHYVEPGLGGFLGATEATREVAMKEWLNGPLLTAGAIFLIAALIFRSLVVSGILISILLITLYAQYGLGGYYTSIGNWSGNLHFATLVSLSIALGLGVDYGIYMLSRLREEIAEQGHDWETGLRNTLCTTGSAVIVSVVVLLGSFIPLLNTELANTWALGLYISEALIIDVFTSLTLLPLLVYWLKPSYVFKA